jgi:transposase
MYDIATRAQALALKLIGRSNAEIEEITGIPPRTLQQIYRRAVERGLEPSKTAKLIDIYIVDAPRSGRPTKQTQKLINDVISKVRQDRFRREKSCTKLGTEVGGVSSQTGWRILRAAGFRKTKPARKLGLSEDMKTKQLQFAKDHEHWTLEDWKRVIWSDETSVVCGHRRGGYRAWRQPDEKFIYLYDLHQIDRLL